MSKCFSFCAAALAAVWGFVASGATTNRAETVTREGFTLVEMSYDGNPCWHAYMMKVDLDTKDLKFDIVYPDNKIGAKKVLSGMSSQLKTALDNEYGSSSADVVVGINGDFFGGDGFTQRANVRNGEQLQSGYDGNIFGWGAEGESLYETTSGEFKFGKVYFGGSVKIDGKTWAIKDVNTLQYNTSGLAVYTAKCLQKFPAAGLKIKFDAPFAAGGSITVADKKFKVGGQLGDRRLIRAQSDNCGLVRRK